ncbi:MAG: hypothetical protein FWE98_04340 [Oscillospiraceae bacterium]|nr:hypothetical protein [Oscillospiraceae bacterium]
MSSKKARRAIGAAALAVGAAAAYDIAKNLSIRAIPDLPKKDPNPNLVHDLLFYLERPDARGRDGVVIDDAYIVNAITPAKVIIDSRFDCMDFRMQSLLRLQYSHIDAIRAVAPTGARMIEEIFLNAKYWMTEPGEDSMCYWSENHQILFAVAEYLAGQAWPDETFTNDGAKGRAHMARGRARIGYWMEQRFAFGYSEYNSANYYRFNIGPASNFIQFAAPEDAVMVQRMKMCMDLLFFDLACYAHKGSLLAPTGRAYTDNMVGVTGCGVRNAISYFWQENKEAADSRDSQWTSFFVMLNAKDNQGKPYYELPKVLYEIGHDSAERELRASYSLDTSELPARNLVGHGDAQMMRQLSMEAFTNPEVIHNTITYLHDNKMLSNKFVNYFKIINLGLIKNYPTLRSISKNLKPMPNGIAIQRSNLYCWQTPHYALASLQRYHPGSFGAQQMLHAANFGGKSVVFTTHPARHEAENTVSSPPGYWEGYGRAPHSAQQGDVLLLLYRLPKRSGFLELYPVPQFTHTYLPEAYFDEVRIDGRYAFARAGEGYLSLTGAGPLEYKEFSEMSAKAFKNGMTEHPDTHFDLIQHGREQYWIYELSDSTRESFEAFIERIKSNRVAYDGVSLVYESKSTRYETQYNGEFRVDGQEISLEHRRFDNPYCVAERDAPEFLIVCNGHSLRLHFEKGEREVV